MPALYQPVDTAIGLLRLGLDGDPQEMVITLGLQRIAEDPPDAETMAEDLADAAEVSGSIIGEPAEYFTQWTFIGATVRLMTATGIVVGEAIRNEVGTATGESPPNNTALLVKKNTGLGGRHERGRCFMPLIGVDESDISNNGMLVAAELTSQQTRWTAFDAALTTEDLLPVLLHYPYTGQPTPAPTPITQFAVQRQVATQRRRMRR